MLSASAFWADRPASWELLWFHTAGALAGARALVKRLLSCLPWKSGGAASDAQRVKDEYWKQHGQLTELERRQAEVRQQMGHDFGPSGAFLALLDRWPPSLRNHCAS